MIKAIIFDLDDTIIDFSKIASKCYQETAIELGLKKVSTKIISRYFGTPHDYMIKKLWHYKDVKKFENKVFKKIKSKKFKAFKGALKTIYSLKRNYRLAILSSKSRVIMDPSIKQIKLKRYLFEFIYSKNDLKYHKPDPKVFEVPLRQLKLKKEEVIYVGDSIFDCIASKKAKINFIAVLTGHYKKDEFKKYNIKDNNILKSVNQLPNLLKNE